MKKTKIFAFALISFIALNLISCTSNSDDDSGNPVVPSTEGYWPSSVNNQWVFIKNGVMQPPTKMVSIDAISGNNYYTFSPEPAGSGASATTRIRKSGNDYYLRMESITTQPSGAIPGTTTTGSETILLKDDLPVGGTWSASYVQTTTYSDPLYPAQTMDIDITSTIIEKDISFVVRGITYTNVIKMQRALSYTTATGSGYSSTYYWFSKGVGPIKINTMAGSGTTDQELVSHIVN